MKLMNNQNANVKMIGGVIALLVSLAIGILVAYSIVGTINSHSLDTKFEANTWTSDAAEAWVNVSYNTTDAQNATNDTLNQMGTFFTIAPILAIVVVAVIILGYVSRIGGG